VAFWGLTMLTGLGILHDGKRISTLLKRVVTRSLRKTPM
jgi:hypothetical protein